MKSIFNINGWIADKLAFSYGLWLLIAAVVFALLCLCLVIAVRSGRLKARQMFIETGWTALWYFGFVALSFLFRWPFGAKKALIPAGSPTLVWCILAAVALVSYIWYFRRRRKKSADMVSATAIRRSAAGSGAAKYCFALLFSGMLVSSVICGIRAAGGDSIFHLVLPMLVVVVSLLLFYLTRWRVWFCLGAVAILAYALFFMQNCLAETSFMYYPLVAMIPLYLAAILPMFSLTFIKQR